MLGSKKLIDQLEKRIAEQAAQYEARILELKHQIQDLQKLVFSPTSATHVPLVSLEADSIMSQKEETIQLSDQEIAELDAIESEANRILSGNY